MSLRQSALIAILNEIARQAMQADNAGEPWADGCWAPKIKDALAEVGERKGYTSAYIGHPQEFLYDLIWVRKDQAGRIVDVPLVAEIEWANREEVWYDFQKLPVARADVRVMIFTGHRGLLGELRDYVCQYAHRGDRYLLAAYTRDDAGHHFTVVESVGLGLMGPAA